MRRPRLLDRRRGGTPPAGARFESGRVTTPMLELIDDDELERLNELLPWRCFTVDGLGRPFGGAAWAGKRTDPQPVPDPRIVELDERFGLAGKRVLEVGCFEGVHTVALCRFGADVTAIDARVENVVKTIVRCAFFDQRPRVLTIDLEKEPPDPELVRAEICHHVGVLYHLSDPVTHLRRLGDWIADGVMLDTHYSTPQEATDVLEVDGEAFRYKRFRESGREDAFSGVRDHAKWLELDTITRLLADAGFGNVDVAQRREERNGPRALVFARRS